MPEAKHWAIAAGLVLVIILAIAGAVAFIVINTEKHTGIATLTNSGSYVYTTTYLWTDGDGNVYTWTQWHRVYQYWFTLSEGSDTISCYLTTESPFFTFPSGRQVTVFGIWSGDTFTVHTVL